jgi:hypothetical protein
MEDLRAKKKAYYSKIYITGEHFFRILMFSKIIHQPSSSGKEKQIHLFLPLQRKNAHNM